MMEKEREREGEKCCRNILIVQKLYDDDVDDDEIRLEMDKYCCLMFITFVW